MAKDIIVIRHENGINATLRVFGVEISEDKTACQMSFAGLIPAGNFSLSGDYGPRALAFAILQAIFENPNLTKHLHEKFYWDFLANCHRNKEAGFEISSAEVLKWVFDNGGSKYRVQPD